MKQIFHITAVMLLVLIFISSCSDNPADEGMIVGVGGNLFNSKFEGTILKADLLFDGTVIASANFEKPTAAAQLVGTVNSAKKGSHTISFRITNQTSSPNTYETVGANMQAGNSAYMLDDQIKPLSTGESISFTVNL